MKTLHAGRLVLEPLTVAHASLMFPVLQDPEIYRYLDYEPPPTLEHLESVYRQLEHGRSPDGTEQWLNWIVRDERGAALGFVQATVTADRLAWVAYVLGRASWGKGIAAAATSTMLRYLEGELDVGTFLATVEADNLSSIGLLLRLGFSPSSRAAELTPELTATERLYERCRAAEGS
jgi:RimJ/RimL family protein N-acetyltransferase